jgi:hypothetical protein
MEHLPQFHGQQVPLAGPQQPTCAHPANPPPSRAGTRPRPAPASFLPTLCHTRREFATSHAGPHATSPVRVPMCRRCTALHAHSASAGLSCRRRRRRSWRPPAPRPSPTLRPAGQPGRPVGAPPAPGWTAVQRLRAGGGEVGPSSGGVWRARARRYGPATGCAVPDAAARTSPVLPSPSRRPCTASATTPDKHSAVADPADGQLASVRCACASSAHAAATCAPPSRLGADVGGRRPSMVRGRQSSDACGTARVSLAVGPSARTALVPAPALAPRPWHATSGPTRVPGTYSLCVFRRSALPLLCCQAPQRPARSNVRRRRDLKLSLDPHEPPARHGRPALAGGAQPRPGARAGAGRLGPGHPRLAGEDARSA